MRWVALLLLTLAGGCANDEVLGPPCLVMPLQQSIVFSGAGVNCTFREHGLPQPWLDLAGCEISLLLPTGHACDEVGGREVEGQDDRVRCVLERLVVLDRTLAAPPPSGMGWFWDDFTTDMLCPLQPSPNTFSIVPTPLDGTFVELACLVSVAPESGPNASCFVDACEPGLSCDAVRDRCSAPCTSDAECEAAGLAGWICDRRPRNEIDPRERETVPNDFCVNPTCEVE